MTQNGEKQRFLEGLFCEHLLTKLGENTQHKSLDLRKFVRLLVFFVKAILEYTVMSRLVRNVL